MLHQISSKQFLPITKEEGWEFLSSPLNLSVITPPEMRFDILSGFATGDKMYAGQIIEYKVKPLQGISMHWVTEITQVDAGNYFVDEQRFGPYTLWHHKHFLNTVEGGIEMVDLIHYKLPLGFVGRWINSLFVKKKLQQIFKYRYMKLQELFGTQARDSHSSAS